MIKETIEIQKNIPLKEFTTFKIGGTADYFVIIHSVNTLKEALLFATQEKIPVFILGGGSNVLISDQGFRGLVIYMQIRGFQIISQDEKSIYVKIASGESWDTVVETAVQNGWWGIENLSHIPGSMGGFAVQNVGAYGQEASQVVEKVSVVQISTGEEKQFAGSECEFGYRSSIFNRKHKGEYVITHTTLHLLKEPSPNLSYADLSSNLKDQEVSLYTIRKSIIEIRNKKFPFPKDATNGSAGSFFKNAILSDKQYEALTASISRNFDSVVLERWKNQLPRPGQSGYKVSSAFLLDICGFKGFVVGEVKVNSNQPLVLLNRGKAKAEDILDLANRILTEVYNKTGVILEPEPEFIGFTKEELNRYLVVS